jgi:hypothetical protein
VAVEVDDRARFLALRHEAKPPGDFLIGFLDSAEILAETILVELLV